MRHFTTSLLAIILFAACTSPSQHRRMEAMLADYEQRNSQYDTLSIDSTRRMADFFSRHGDAHQRMRAYYLLGCAHETAGESPQALDQFNKLFANVDKADTDSHQLLMKAHCQKANIFLLQYLPKQALAELDSASRLASLLKDTSALLRIESNKTVCYYELGQFANMRETSERVFNAFCEYGDSTQAAYAISSAIYVALERGDWKKALSWLDFFEKYKDKADLEKNAMFDYYKSRVLLHEGKGDSAILMIGRMRKYNNSLNNQILANHTLLQIYEKKGITDSVCKYAERYCNANDSSMKEMATIQLGRMEAMYNYGNAQRLAATQALKAKRFQVIMLILLVSIFAIASIFYFFYNRINNKRKEEQKLFNCQYRDLLGQYNNTSNDLQQLACQLDRNNELVIQKEKELDKLKQLLARFYEEGFNVNNWHLENDIYQTEIVCRMHSLASIGKCGSDSDWTLLRATVNRYLPQFLPNLSEYCNNLNLRETNLCILVKLNFIPTEIAVLLSMKKQSVVNLRVRLLRKIFHVEGNTKMFDDKIHEIMAL